MAGATQHQYAAIVDAYRSRLHDRHIFLSPDIPPKRLRVAIETYAPDVDEADVLALVDGTVMGSAKDGGLLTVTALYGHEANGHHARVDLSDLRALTTDQRPTGSLVIADGQLVFSAGIVAFHKVEVFADMVRDVARMERPATVSSEQPPPSRPERQGTVPSQRADKATRKSPEKAHDEDPETMSGPVSEAGRTESSPARSERSSDVPLDLFHLVSVHRRLDTLDASMKDLISRTPLTVTRPARGKVLDRHNCPRCGTTFMLAVYSRALLDRNQRAGRAGLVGGLAGLVLVAVLQGVWAAGTIPRVVDALVLAAALTAAIVGGAMVLRATRLEQSHGVRVGPLGRNEVIYQGGTATHALALRDSPLRQ